MPCRKAKEAETSRDEAEFRKKESDSLRTVAEGKADRADIEQMLAQINADSAEKERALAFYLSKISEQEKLLAEQQAEEANRQSETFKKEKEESVKTAEKAIEQQSASEKEKIQEFNKRMLSIAQTMAGKVSEVEDKNLKGLLAYQAYLFNRDLRGTSRSSRYLIMRCITPWSDLTAINYNGLQGHEGAVRSLAFLPGSGIFFSSGGDGKILRWDLNGNTKSYRTLIDNNFINRSLAISPNGRWLACGTTTTGIQLFNLNIVKQSSLHSCRAIKVGWKHSALHPTAKDYFQPSTDKSIIYWDLIAETNTVFITLENTRVRCLAVSPSSGFIFGGTDDGQLIRWNMDTKEESVIFSSDNNSIYAICH